MSFSSKVKGELSLHFGNGRHCEIAEIAAYVNIYGQIAVFGGNFCLKIQTENDYAVKKCFTLLRNTFNMIADVSVRISGQKRQTKVYPACTRCSSHLTGNRYFNNRKRTEETEKADLSACG